MVSGVRSNGSLDVRSSTREPHENTIGALLVRARIEISEFIPDTWCLRSPSAHSPSNSPFSVGTLSTVRDSIALRS